MSIRSLKTGETINEKQKRRAESVVHVEKRKAVEETVDHLYEWVDKLHVDLSEAKSRVKEARKDTASHQTKLNKANTVAVKQLDLLKSFKTSLNETKDELADESHARAALERMRTIQINIKNERPVGRPGGLKRWLVYSFLLICKMLVNGTHPTAVPANIKSSCALFTGVEATELPCVNFVRQFRVVFRI